MVFPVALVPARYLRTKASLTTATCGDVCVSRLLNPRPVRRGISMVSKYSGLTHANLDPPSAPFTRTPRFQVLLGFKGMSVEVADDSTCGTVFPAASKSRIKGTYRSGGKAKRVKST